MLLPCGNSAKSVFPVKINTASAENSCGRLDRYRKILQECAAKFPQIHLLDGAKLLDNEGKYFADAVHPNAEGMKMVAERAAALSGC